ncbi:MAG TPA: phosphopantothenoylcysteine decarboxylase [Candidatus Margulisiibacteriota bacterium]|nr:phosphopantothenoylcysteine decarboxylase [Candidatus Margulisiibacteriota bacterium]
MDIHKSESFKNRRVLITAGATWVALDAVRVISNTASGETGIKLAEMLSDEGARVTLLLGPVSNLHLKGRVRVLNFKFFEELKSLMEKELKAGGYDILIHSAAVSDYRPEKKHCGKVSSTNEKWRLSLVPTEKIINRVREFDKDIFLVGFKFEPNCTRKKLIIQARKLMREADPDLIVANTCGSEKKAYRSFIVSRDRISKVYSSKKTLSSGLIRSIREGLGRAI